MMIFDRRHEAMPRDEMEQLQLERLQALIARLRRNVPRYKKILGSFQVKSLADLAAIQPTTPEDLGAGFPFGMFALPLREVVRLHSAVGPGGMQLVVGHTRNDLTHWARLAARQLVAAGGSAHDVIQLGFGGTFTQSLGYMLGAELVGASVIPQDSHHTEYQLAMMQSYRPSIVITTPTQAHELIRILAAREIDPQSLALRTVVLSRPVDGAQRASLQSGLFADIRCTFGVAEVLNPGLCVECPQGHLHVNEDEFYVECDDGELLVTTLAREAMPLVRYRTRVRCGIERRKCPCARTGAILSPGARLDGRLRVGETPLYRTQIEALLRETRAGDRPFRLVVSENEVSVLLRVTSELFPDTVRAMQSLKSEIESAFFTRLGIRANVGYLEPRSFDKPGGAAET